MTDRRAPARRVAVLGAYGHTGRFVVAELRRRGFDPIVSGRDADRLRRTFPGSEVRPATVDDSASLDRSLMGADAMVNCAGPFAVTAAPVIEAALRAGIPYLDVTAEVEVVADTVAAFSNRAYDAGVAVVTAAAFYGGLGDLLATAAVGDWLTADRISIAYALSSWRPTRGTRATGRVSAQRRQGRRIIYADGAIRGSEGEAPVREWSFPDPIGPRAVVGQFTMADSATIPMHLAVRDIETYMTVDAVTDLRSPDPAPPAVVDEAGRSAQTFLVEVLASRGDQNRRAVAGGQDIYAVSAPLVVAAAGRVLAQPGDHRGVLTAGMLGDAQALLRSLHPHHLRRLACGP